MHARVSKEPAFCDKYWCIKLWWSANVYFEFSVFVSHIRGIYSFCHMGKSREQLRKAKVLRIFCSSPFLFGGRSFIRLHSYNYHTNTYVHEVGFLSSSLNGLPRTSQPHKHEWHVEFPALMSSWVEGYNLRNGWLFCHQDWSIKKALIPHPVCFWVSSALLPRGSRRHCIFLQQISSLNILFFLEWVSTPIK